MQIECPNCGTRYRVDADRLRPEGTRVRCSNCNYRFLAFPEWQSEDGWDLDLGLDFGAGADDSDESPAAGPAEAPLTADEEGTAGVAPSAPGGEAGGRRPADGRRRSRGKRRRGPPRQADSGRRASSLMLGLLVLLLVGGLVAELGYAFRSQLLAQPWVRSAVKGGLGLAGLDWELPIALGHYRVDAINARLITLSSGRRVTLLEGLLVNGAPFSQGPPRLELRAEGPGGRVRFRKVVAPGSRLDLDRGMVAADLRQRWQQARADFPETMGPGQEEPFLVVLTDVPPGVRRFQVEMVE